MGEATAVELGSLVQEVPAGGVSSLSVCLAAPRFPISPATKTEVGIGEHPVGAVRRLCADPTVSRDQLSEVGGGRPHASRKKGIELCGGRSECRLTDRLRHRTSSTTVAAAQRLECCTPRGLTMLRWRLPHGYRPGTRLCRELAHLKASPFSCHPDGGDLAGRGG